ncbi:hypothetical protein D3C86_1681980 [compost metagenome]
MVHHRIHTACRYSEKVFGLPQFLEIPQIVPPVRLGNDPDLKTLAFNDPANYSSTESRMIHVGITGNQDDIQFIPPPLLNFFFSQRQPVCYWSFKFHLAKLRKKSLLCLMVSAFVLY